MFKALMQKHPGAERWCIFIL
jgi:hypothetical protein